MSGGERFTSLNPATQAIIWEGKITPIDSLPDCIKRSKKAFSAWSLTTLSDRIAVLRQYAEIVNKEKKVLTQALSEEMGKPLWEAATEIDASIQKVAISITAYQERCKEQVQTQGSIASAIRYKPQGVLAVFGPFNFPLHLPNGHIVPALLAGNTVLFKASEHTPRIAERMAAAWQKAGLPPDVLQIIQGDAAIGKALAAQPGLSGILFTGSANTGISLNRLFAEDPSKMLALEMGGNNPLVIHDVNLTESKAACHHLIMSAFLTSGQRCSCARRLIVVDNADNRSLINTFLETTERLTVGSYSDTPEPFMGPVISIAAANHIKAAYQLMLTAGAKPLIPLRACDPAWIYPTIVDVTGIHLADEEIFGPILQLIWVSDLAEAIRVANRTDYGLTAGIFTADLHRYTHFYQQIQAGIINWNRPLTGASSTAPFGGIGRSGNHRPSAYFAADYCAYPVASQESGILELPPHLSPGISL